MIGYGREERYIGCFRGFFDIFLFFIRLEIFVFVILLNIRILGSRFNGSNIFKIIFYL